MSTARTFYTYPLQLLNARVVSTTNLAATYFNGPNNSGVGATLTSSSAGALTIDSVSMNLNDAVLVNGQTSSFQNGIYTVTNPGNAGTNWVLQRRADFQTIDQIKSGQYLTISAGTVNAGAVFVMIEPLPTIMGVSPITFDSATASAGLGTAATKNASNNADPSLASVTGTYVVGDIATFSDPNGSLGDSGIQPSNPALTKVASVNGATVVGNFLVAADTAGTFQDGGAAIHSTVAAIPGGNTTFSVPITGMTSGSNAVICSNSVTNAAYITGCQPGAGVLDVTYNTDPGVSGINILWTTAAF